MINIEVLFLRLNFGKVDRLNFLRNVEEFENILIRVAGYLVIGERNLMGM